MERERLLNVPNALTTLRMALIIAFAAVHVALPERRALALVLFLLAAATDCLDGYLARRLHQVTWLGKLLDPAADKLMIVAVLVCLVTSHVLPVWVMALVVMKEMYMGAGALLLFHRGVVVSSDLLGKVSTALFVPAAVCLYPWHQMLWLTQLGGVLMILSLALSFAAAAHYTAQALLNNRAR